MDDILRRAEELLGPPVHIDQRGWGTWWCPFHPDAERGGKRGRPNFGVHLEKGHWRCFVCGARGPSIDALAKALGEETRPRFQHRSPRPRRPQGPSLALIAYALGEARAAFRDSPAEHYVVIERKIHPRIAQMYGLGYGVAYPDAPPAVQKAGREARLVTARGWWLWAGGVVYADPPAPTPLFIQVRHLRDNAPSKYQTWGMLSRPGGAWLVSEETEALVVVEGLFDMLALAQILSQGLLGRVVPVYTVGGGSTAQLDWLRQQRKRKRRIYLIPDPDPAGNAWVERIREKVGRVRVFRPPAGRDPDEAILLDGWWPF